MAASWAHHKGHQSAHHDAVREGLPRRPLNRACSGIEAVTCRATPRQRVVHRSSIASSMKSFIETDSIAAAYAAILFSRPKASGPARLCVMRLNSTIRQAPVLMQPYLFRLSAYSVSSGAPVVHAAAAIAQAAGGCVTHFHHDRTAEKGREQVTPLVAALPVWRELRCMLQWPRRWWM